MSSSGGLKGDTKTVESLLKQVDVAEAFEEERDVQ